MLNGIRIIGGKWKRSRIFVANYTDIRPTMNCVRETLFNWLYTVIPNSICLDCFAGTGALGLEALSRGASRVTFLESNLMRVQILWKTIRSFKATHNSEIFCTDSLSGIQRLNKAYDIVFIDPPFKENVIPEIVFLLEKYNCFKKKSWIYIETSKSQNILNNTFFPHYWVLYRIKIMKTVKYCLYLRNV